MTTFKHGCSSQNGHAGTWEYSIWGTMRQRCNNPKSAGYAHYGGRGITVCARWDSFENFIADMGVRPSKNHSIDRVDNDGPYSPENCRWATRIEQKANQRPRNDAIWVQHNGECKTIDDWARVTGIKHKTLSGRIRRYGWPIEKALTTPTRSLRKRGQP